MTAKTVSAPAPAPSVASESARQLASLVKAAGRPRRAVRSLSNGRPFSQVEFAFLIRPVAGEMAPGWLTPTVPRRPSSRSASSIMVAMVSIVPS